MNKANLAARIMAATLLSVGAALGYWLYLRLQMRKEANMGRQEETILFEEGMSLKTYRLVLPVRDIEQVCRLAPLGALLASVRDGVLLALNVVPLAKATSSYEKAQLVKQGQALLNAVTTESHNYPAPVWTMLTQKNDIAASIIETARQRNPKMLLLEWSANTRSHNRTFGPIIHTISQNPPSDIAIICIRHPWSPPQRILVPSRGKGPHARMAFELARDIATFYARPENGALSISIHSLHVHIPNKHNDFDLFQRQIETISQELDIPIKLLNLKAESVVEGIVDASQLVDLIIMGASEQGFLAQRLFGNIPEDVMLRSNVPVIVCKRHQGKMANFVRRFF